MNFNASVSMQTSPLSPNDVPLTGISCMQIGLDFVFYGVQAALSLSAVAALIHKHDRSRLIMAAVVALWLSSTLEVILDIKSHIIQLQALSRIPSVSTRDLLLHLTITSEMCFRFNFFVSDVIVVWRAWVLWPQNRMAKSVLLLCITGSLVGLLIASVWWVNSLLGQPLPAGAPFLVTVPLLFTNTVSTALPVPPQQEFNRPLEEQDSRGKGVLPARGIGLLVLHALGAYTFALLARGSVG
ncbi:hypothetical protein EV715DRAFT_263745 [Schizophyllum commune]